MKKYAIHLVIIAVLLQGCAGQIQPQKDEGSVVIEGSKQISLSGADCPGSVSTVNIYTNTLKGDVTAVNAILAWTSKPVDKNINTLNATGQNISRRTQRRKYKVDTDTSSNSVSVLISGMELDAGAVTVGDSSTMFATADTKATEKVPLQFDSKTKSFKGWKELENSVLTQKDQTSKNDVVAKSISIKVGKKVWGFAIPDPIDSDKLDHALSEKFSAPAGEVMAVVIAPMEKPRAAFLHAQFFQKGSAKKYEFTAQDDNSGVFKINTKGIPVGTYALNIFRGVASKIGAEDEKGIARCVEIGSGVMGLAEIAKPAAPKK